MLPWSTSIASCVVTFVVTAVDVGPRHHQFFIKLAGWGPKLYLRRNLHPSMRKGAPPAQRVSRLNQCYIRNGLECKLKQDDGGNSVRSGLYQLSTVSSTSTRVQVGFPIGARVLMFCISHPPTSLLMCRKNPHKLRGKG